MNRHWSAVPSFDPSQGRTIVDPPSPGRGAWAGAPGICCEERWETWMVYRLRRPHPWRGYLLRIAHSPDGLHFGSVWEAHKEAFATESIERCALVHPAPNDWRLFVSYVDPADRRWRIDMIRADAPDTFNPEERTTVMTAKMADVEAVKDPVVYNIAGLWYMFVSYSPKPKEKDDTTRGRLHETGDVFATGLTRSATGLCVSQDGERWHWHGEVFANRPGAWDAYAGRITSVLWKPPFFVAFYDGSRAVEENYEEMTGLAFSADLRRWERTSLNSPAYISPHGSGSLRYVDVANHGDEWRMYYEMCRPDGSHELRMNRVVG